MTKVISSFDSYPIKNNRWERGNKFKETMYFTAYSMLRASEFYDVTIYCDEDTAKCLKNLPIAIEVFKTSFDYAGRDMWVESKFYAYSQQSAPFIHIDTDVILYEDVFKSLDFYDVICERRERDSFKHHYKEQVEFFNSIMKEDIVWKGDLDFSINCGIVGFNDLSSRDVYIENYNKLKHLFRTNLSKFWYLQKRHYEPCLVLEQYNLIGLVKSLKLDLKILLDKGSFKAQNRLAKRIGYTHLAGDVKYADYIQQIIKNKFYKLYPKQYQEVDNHLKHKA